jgi:hypothetical protein
MRNATLQAESKKANGKSTKQSLTKSETSETQSSHMVKSQLKIRETYQGYVEAQKDFEDAFKDRERENQEAFKDAEKKYKAYENALETAFTDRETAEQSALGNYQKTVESARVIYSGAMKKALLDCQKSTEQARHLLVGIPVKEAEGNSESRLLFTLRVRKPNLEPVKRGFQKSKNWLESKTGLITHKLQRQPATETTESVAE